MLSPGTYDSPASKRYTLNFENEIKEKLSSTIFRTREDASQIVNSSSDSSLQLIENKEQTIEISSSDNDVSIVDNKENIINVPKDSRAQTIKSNVMQPKINAAIAKKPATNHQYVSQRFYDKELKKLEDLKQSLSSTERCLQTISISSLPDGGKQLKARIQALRNDLEIKTNYLSTLRLEEQAGHLSGPNSARSSINKSLETKSLGSLEIVSPPINPEMKSKKAFFNNNAPSWDELSSAVNQIVPKHTGKQGMATFENQKALTVERLKVRLDESY